MYALCVIFGSCSSFEAIRAAALSSVGWVAARRMCRSSWRRLSIRRQTSEVLPGPCGSSSVARELPTLLAQTLTGTPDEELEEVLEALAWLRDPPSAGAGSPDWIGEPAWPLGVDDRPLVFFAQLPLSARSQAPPMSS
jgi:hypothetical protein